MRIKNYIVIVLSVIFASCSSLQQSVVNDDLYYSPKDDAVTSSNIAEKRSFKETQSVSSMKDYENQISAILEDDSKETIDTLIYESDETGNPYEDILVRDRDEAYQKRLDGFSNPYYGFNNYAIYMTDAYWYASAYDPYFYNIVIMGDQIWVEPKYITSSFGYWPRRSVYSYGFGGRWGFGYYSYYDPYYYGYSPYYSYYSPYYSNYYGYYSPYRNYYNDNYVGSSFHSYRQRSLASRYSASSGAVRSGRSQGEITEEYMGRGVSRSSTVRDGLDRQTRTSRSGVVAGGERTRSSSDRVTRTTNSRSNTGSSTGTYTRSGNSNRSTYNTSRGTATRYNRPSSTSRSSVGSSSSSTRSSSSYSNSRSNSRSNSGSSYRSSGSSRSSSSGSGSSVRSSGSSSSSGSSRSSGSSSSGSSRSSSGASRSRR